MILRQQPAAGRAAVRARGGAGCRGLSGRVHHRNGAFLRRIDECNSVPDFASDVGSRFPFAPLLAERAGVQVAVGAVPAGLAPVLVSAGQAFEMQADCLTISRALDGAPAAVRTEAVAEVTAALRADGLVPGWRDEMYPVLADFGEEPLLLVERATASLFGITSYECYANGYTTCAESDRVDGLWIARRSPAKATWPGRLDVLVGGGLPHGITPGDNLIKECAEEAGVPLELAAMAVSVGAIGYAGVRKVGEFDVLERACGFTFDLRLPKDFVPRNTDGEVDILWASGGFDCRPAETVLELIAAGGEDFKPNCQLVVLDFAVRHGFITPDQPGYMDIVRGLRAGPLSGPGM